MTAISPPTTDYLAAPNRVVSAANGIDYAYRQVGEGTPALVLLQHFRGNLDNWDPALVDALARDRPVVTFDNAGVGGSTGTTPSTIAQMAQDAIAFLEALELHAEFAHDVDAFLRAPTGEQTRASLGATLERQHQPRAKHSLERRAS